ncbi:MAG: hypothetical protein GMKNLPBB_00162 [Myxococcota bacterium]|nr:hypothetical protein [Myxococcota bacterium]
MSIRTMEHNGPRADWSFRGAVKWLLIINAAIYLMMLIAWQFSPGLVEAIDNAFGLTPRHVVREFRLWELFTYHLLHSVHPAHVILNLLFLWMFGGALEYRWGARGFITFYLACAVLAGVFVVAAGYLFSKPEMRTIGASGAVYGLMAAWAALWPEHHLYIYGIVRLKVKWMVLGIIIYTFLAALAERGMGAVSHAAHLGGLVSGYLYLKAWWFAPAQIRDWIRLRYLKWKLRRLKMDVIQGGGDRKKDREYLN